MANGLVVSALGIRARVSGFDSWAVPVFHCVATLGKLFTHIASPVSRLQETAAQKESCLSDFHFHIPEFSFSSFFSSLIGSFGETKLVTRQFLSALKLYSLHYQCHIVLLLSAVLIRPCKYHSVRLSV